MIIKLAMQTTIGEAGLNQSWQAKFPQSIKCSCGSDSRIAFVAHEAINGEKPKKFVCNLHKNEKNNMWPHDAIAVAVYFCKKCMKPIAEYNQA